jgi:hypothetical protein
MRRHERRDKNRYVGLAEACGEAMYGPSGDEVYARGMANESDICTGAGPLDPKSAHTGRAGNARVDYGAQMPSARSMRGSWPSTGPRA